MIVVYHLRPITSFEGCRLQLSLTPGSGDSPRAGSVQMQHFAKLVTTLHESCRNLDDVLGPPRTLFERLDAKFKA